MNVHLRLRGRTPPWVQLSDSYRLILPLQKIPMFTPSTCLLALVVFASFFSTPLSPAQMTKKNPNKIRQKNWNINTEMASIRNRQTKYVNQPREAICGFIIKFFFFIHRKLTHAFKERIQVKSKTFVLKISLPTWLPLLHSLSLCPLFPFVPGPSGVIYSIVLL